MDPVRSAHLANGADALTSARFLAAVAVVPLLVSGRWHLVALLISLAWITDLLDGRLSRLSGVTTRLEAFDLAADTFFGAGVLIGSTMAGLVPSWFGIAAVVAFGGLFVAGNVAAGMMLQLAGYIPVLIELWQQRPLTWWTPLLVALIALVVDWRRLVEINIPAFLRGLAGRFEHKARTGQR